MELQGLALAERLARQQDRVLPVEVVKVAGVGAIELEYKRVALVPAAVAVRRLLPLVRAKVLPRS